MFIPISTDAPVYHWPFATVGTIVVNVFAFMVTSSLDVKDDHDRAILEQLVLQYGHGLRPWQWVTSNYVHADFIHLLGNMIIVWAFGLVVEGKIGWWKYLLLYNGIGILECAVEQSCLMFADEGASYGASAIAFGLIAVAMVWAPANEMSVFFGRGLVDVSIYTYAGFSFLVELIFGGLAIATADNLAAAITSQILHLAGAAVGFAVGVVMLKKGWVDCENWDLFSWWSGRNELTREELAEQEASRPESKLELAKRQQAILDQIRAAIAAGQTTAAQALNRKAGQMFAGWRLPEPEYVQLIQKLRAQYLWNDVVNAIVDYLRGYSERATIMRLALAQVLIEQQQRPTQALRVLAKLNEAQLDPRQREAFGKLRVKAQQLAKDFPYEAANDDW